MSKKVQVEVKGRKWDINSLKELLLKNDKAVMKAVSLIYSFQTCEEQYSNNTKNVNGQGYSKYDAQIMSSFAQQIETTGSLSPKQIDVARKRIVKYRKQIFDYMRANA